MDPVYDREWSLNLDRRVFAPKKMAYLKFGNGKQKMSALARPNLVDFIDHLIHRFHRLSQITDKPSDRSDLYNQRNPCNLRNLRMNVCDAEPYEFNQIIQAFKQSGIHPHRPTIPIPLSLVWLLTRTAGLLLPKKKQWLHSAYSKLTQDLIFNNTRMLTTGFTPKHTLNSILHPQITQIDAD